MYEPTNYNYGTIWPFTSYFIGAAQFCTHFNIQGYETVKKTAQHAFDYGIGIVPEVFSGDINTKLGEAYHDQGFSVSGYIFPLMNGLAGIDADALNKKITFAPKIPADWKFLKVNNVKIGTAVVANDLQIGGGIMNLLVNRKGTEEIDYEFAPDFPLGTEIISVLIDGKSSPYDLIKHDQACQVIIKFKTADKNEVKINFNPAPAIYSIAPPAAIGAVNEGLKIISQNLAGKNLKIICQGKPGKFYEIGITNTDRIKNLSGAEIRNQKLIITIPGGGDEFVNHEIGIEIK
jgi:hypothetical protein